MSGRQVRGSPYAIGVAHVSASFSAILRVRLPDEAGSFGRVATAIGAEGALLGEIDLVRVETTHKVRDVTILAEDETHIERVVAAVNAIAGVEVQAVSDCTFLSHLGGKLEIHSRVSLKTRDDLSMAYTPGVARVSTAIARDPETIWNLTIKRNTVAVVSDGSAVLGLGDIGPGGALPVMEGKAILFKGVRRRRCLSDLPGHEGHRGDHPDRQGNRAGLRRDQPRGHLGAALLRDRAAVARDAGHPGVP